MTPKYITHKEAAALLESGENGKCRPLGLFYEIGIDTYIGIDNSTGEARVEEFETKAACLEWLNGRENSKKDNSENQHELSFKIALYTTFVLYALSMKRSMESGVMDGSVFLFALPLIVWFFVFSVKDYIDYDRAERRKEKENKHED